MRIARLVLLAAAAAAVAAVAGRHGFWLCLPLGLAVAAGEPAAKDGLLAGAGVLAAAALAGNSPALVGLVSGLLSLAVVTVLRLRLERERDAMRQFALRDPLTGLANRRALGDRMRHEVARHVRQGQRFAVLALDLDGFKAINDRFGHDTGDELLREVAAALRAAVRAQDTVARLGGDEFCVVAPETDRGGAAQLTERVLDELQRVAPAGTGVSASVGAAVFPDDGHEPAELLAVADTAALDAKRRRHATRTRRAA